MSSLYQDFENRFSNQWFSAGWSEIEVKPTEEANIVAVSSKKDLVELQAELDGIQQHIEEIAQKKLRLENLSKFYQT